MGRTSWSLAWGVGWSTLGLNAPQTNPFQVKAIEVKQPNVLLGCNLRLLSCALWFCSCSWLPLRHILGDGIDSLTGCDASLPVATAEDLRWTPGCVRVRRSD